MTLKSGRSFWTAVNVVTAVKSNFWWMLPQRPKRCQATHDRVQLELIKAALTLNVPAEPPSRSDNSKKSGWDIFSLFSVLQLALYFGLFPSPWRALWEDPDCHLLRQAVSLLSNLHSFLRLPSPLLSEATVCGGDGISDAFFSFLFFTVSCSFLWFLICLSDQGDAVLPDVWQPC